MAAASRSGSAARRSSRPISAVPSRHCRPPATIFPSDWFDANARKLIPAWGGFSLSGLDVTGPDPTSPGNQANVKIGSFDLSLDHYLNGIPTTISTTASAIEVPVPNDPTDDAAQLLRQAGITTAQLAFDFSASWDKPTKTIAVEKLSLARRTHLLSASMSMVLGNAQEQLFDADNDTASAAAQALTLNSIHVTLTDRGAGDEVVPLLAAQQNTDAKTYRAQVAGQLEAAVLATMGATDDTTQDRHGDRRVRQWHREDDRHHGRLQGSGRHSAADARAGAGRSERADGRLSRSAPAPNSLRLALPPPATFAPRCAASSAHRSRTIGGRGCSLISISKSRWPISKARSPSCRSLSGADKAVSIDDEVACAHRARRRRPLPTSTRSSRPGSARRWRAIRSGRIFPTTSRR